MEFLGMRCCWFNDAAGTPTSGACVHGEGGLRVGNLMHLDFRKASRKTSLITGYIACRSSFRKEAGV